MIKFKDVTISKLNMRINLENVIDLEESIKENGLLAKIILRKNNEKMEVVAGSRRFFALKNLRGDEGSLEDSEYLIKNDLSDKQAAIISIEENQKRINYSPFELNKSILTLNSLGFKSKEIAKCLGVTPHRLKRLETLSSDKNKMPEVVKEELKKLPEEAKITDHHWDYISKKTDDEDVIKDVVDYIIDKEAPAREVPSIIKMVEKNRKAQEGPEHSETPKDVPPPEGSDDPLEYVHKGELVLEIKDGKDVLRVIGKGEDSEVPVEQYLNYLRHPEQFKCYVTFKLKIKPIV
jgi:ParB/RepB/Spo0J family partition protein